MKLKKIFINYKTMKRFTLKMHKKELMKNPKFRKAYQKAKKIKPVYAWAVLEGQEIQSIIFDYQGNSQLSIFPTRADAKAWDNPKVGYKIIKVRITPVKGKV